MIKFNEETLQSRELVKVCALASSLEVPVVAHGHSLLAALQVAGSQSPAVVPSWH